MRQGESSTIPTTSMREIDPGRFGFDEARHLLWRAGFGGTPQQVRTLVEWGPRRAVDHLLDVEDDDSYPRPSADDFDPNIFEPMTRERLQMIRRARQSRDEDALARLRRERQQRQRRDQSQMREIRRMWLTRMIETPRPLEEKMALFWHGHFATSYRKIENSYHMFQQNELFRRYALGNYGELLARIIRDPAMIRYLDNQLNRKGSPNENLARELMELFSLGEGNYSERDIREGARALTGYSFEHNSFKFRRALHDNGVKRILGASGRLDGEDFVRAILAKRRCAEFMVGKLYRFFVREIPDEGDPARRSVERVTESLARTFIGSRYEVRPVLRKLFLSEHFYDRATMLHRIKSPAEIVVGTIRSLGTPVRDLNILLDAMDLMGQNLFFPPSVKGWDGERAWINTSTLFVRQNLVTFLLTGRTPEGGRRGGRGDRFNATRLLGAIAEDVPESERTPPALIDHLSRFVLGEVAVGPRRAALVEVLDAHDGRLDDRSATSLANLMGAMPEYQLT